jgi:hypothetical protein
MPEAPGPVVTDVPARQTPWSLVPPRPRPCPGYGGLIWTQRRGSPLPDLRLQGGDVTPPIRVPRFDAVAPAWSVA